VFISSQTMDPKLDAWKLLRRLSIFGLNNQGFHWAFLKSILTCRCFITFAIWTSFWIIHNHSPGNFHNNDSPLKKKKSFNLGSDPRKFIASWGTRRVSSIPKLGMKSCTGIWSHEVIQRHAVPRCANTSHGNVTWVSHGMVGTNDDKSSVRGVP